MSAPVRLTADEREGGICPDRTLGQVVRALGLARTERLTGHGDKWAPRWIERSDPHALIELRAICRAERELLGTDDMATTVAAWLASDERDEQVAPWSMDRRERELLHVEADFLRLRADRPDKPSVDHWRLCREVAQQRLRATKRWLRDYAAACGLGTRYMRIGALALLLLSVYGSMQVDVARLMRGRRRRRRDNEFELVEAFA